MFWRMLSGRNVQLLRYTASSHGIRTFRIYGKMVELRRFSECLGMGLAGSYRAARAHSYLDVQVDDNGHSLSEIFLVSPSPTGYSETSNREQILGKRGASDSFPHDCSATDPR